MKKIFLLFIVISTINIACSQNKQEKEYKSIITYITTEERPNGELTKDTLSVSDSIIAKDANDAYLDTYRSISSFVLMGLYRYEEKISFSSIKVELFDENGKNIFSIIDFPDRETKEKEKEIWERQLELAKNLFEENYGPLKGNIKQIEIK